MKLKATPEDFRVEEVANVTVTGKKGPYAVYRLAKRSWDTFDLVPLLARRLGVAAADVSVGGMKDRHGETAQLVSVRGKGPWANVVEEKNFRAELEGFTGSPISARDISGNRFTIVMRDMSDAEAAAAARNAAVVRETGIPNYYDEQRFGSARHGQGFMGKEIFLGRREEALRLWFLPSKKDDRKTRALKACVTENWGRWDGCLDLAFGEYRRVLSYLAQNPRAHHKALSLIDKRFLVFAVNAYQSLLFNRVLSLWIEAASRREGFALGRLKFPYCDFLFPLSLPVDAAERFSRLLLPVPGWDSVVEDPTVRGILQQVLQEEGIALSDLRVRQMRRMSAHGVERPAFVRAGDFSMDEAVEDEMYPGRKKIGLAFFLPRGSYATIVVKRICLSTPVRRETPSAHQADP
jgi:tRNA pseudouridine13 synthase